MHGGCECVICVHLAPHVCVYGCVCASDAGVGRGHVGGVRIYVCISTQIRKNGC